MCDSCGGELSAQELLAQIIGEEGTPLHVALEKRYERHVEDLAPMFADYETYLGDFSTPAMAWIVMASRIDASGKSKSWISARLAGCMALAIGAINEVSRLEEKYEPKNEEKANTSNASTN